MEKSKIKNQKSKIKSCKGYTLLELLIYIAILAITTTLIIALIFNLIQAKEKNQVLSEVQENIRFSLEKISQAVRNAKAINEANGSILNLSTFDPATDPTIFSLTPAETIQMKENGGPERELTTNKVRVSSLIFSEIDGPDPTKPPTVSIEITLEYKSSGPTPKAKTTIKTTASLRQ